MPKTKTKIVIKRWKNEDIVQALDAIAAGNSIRSTAKKYGMSEGTLRERIKKIKDGKTMVGSGRRPTLNTDTEKQLAKCIGTMCKLGFSPSRGQIMDLVQEYVRNHKLVTPFKNDRPGKDWLRMFMDRNNLSMKKANMLSAARKSATSNPFIIYDFYDVLEEIIKEKKIKRENIWNCDESGFPSDPQKCKAVSVKGEVAYKVTCGAGRENTTTLAVCNAAGRALDPLVIFSGKNLQSTWRGKNALPETYYAVSDNGWMTTEIFTEWFFRFAEKITERPLLLIFDGHLTHVSIDVVEKAVAEDIIILKLPPHVTDKLQPLDVSCFGPLKREWEKLLNEWINVWGPREPVRKSRFVDMLGTIWHKGLSPENIRAGFQATGIWPLDRSKFPTDRFDLRLIKRYNAWVKCGKPDNVMEELATSVITPRKAKACVSEENTPSVTTAEVETEGTLSTVTPTPTYDFTVVSSSTPADACYCHLLGPIPEPHPGKKWVPRWTLDDNSDKSFEELALDKMKETKDKPVVQRKKMHLKTKIISDPEYLAALKRIESEENKKKRKQAETKKRKAEAQLKKETAKKRIAFESKNEKEPSDEEDVEVKDKEDSQETDEEIIEETEEEIIEDEEESDEGENDEEENDEDEDCASNLKELWKKLSPPVKQDDVVNRWYGAIYICKKKRYLYVGKATRRFVEDADGPVSALELDCLKPHIGTGTIFESVPDHLPRDVDIFPIYNIIAVVDVKPLKGGKWDIPKYPELKKTYENVVHLNREELSQDF